MKLTVLCRCVMDYTVAWLYSRWSWLLDLCLQENRMMCLVPVWRERIIYSEYASLAFRMIYDWLRSESLVVEF